MDALTVATWNIHGGVGLDRRRAPERIAQVLSRLDADVIALQEFAAPHARFEAWRDELEQRLGLRAIVRPTLATARARFGNAVLTRLPVRRATCHDLGVGTREPRNAIELECDWRGAPLRLVATHLGLARDERRVQVARLLPRIAAAGMPVIVLGDLNEPRRRGSLAALERHLTLAASPATFPSPCPLLGLDRVLATAPLRTTLHARRDLLARIASDHLPLVARIERDARADSGGSAGAAQTRRPVRRGDTP